MTPAAASGDIPERWRRRGSRLWAGQSQWYSMASGNLTHECCRASHTDHVGAGKVGSANAPTGTATSSGAEGPLKKTVAPHSGQKQETRSSPSSEIRTYSLYLPSVYTWSASNRACTPNALPVRR